MENDPISNIFLMIFACIYPNSRWSCIWWCPGEIQNHCHQFYSKNEK